MTHANHHCCVVTVDRFGILIEGPSGSGKTSLVLGLIEKASQSGMPAQFVTDDQALLEVRGSKVFAKAPETIKGKVELRGFGIVDLPAICESEIDLVVRLVPAEDIERIPEKLSTNHLGPNLPLLKAPSQHEQASVRIVLAWISEANRSPDQKK